MNDDAAESRGPSGPSQDGPEAAVPATPDTDTPSDAAATNPTAELPTTEVPVAEAPPAWTPPTGGIPEADEPPAATPPPGATPSGTPPGATPGGTPPPPPPGANNMPPWMSNLGNLGGPGFSRDQLVRPRQGRYVAGVCAALARATNTDPVLWRVLIAVLGILSGVGVLLYLIGWLIIPSEGDTASPIESLLGKGRSGMTPLSVILLGAAAVLSFAFIVHSGTRSSVLAAAVVLGAILLIKRRGAAPAGEAATFPAAPAGPPGAVPPPPGPAASTTPSEPTAQFNGPQFGSAQFGSPATTVPAGEPVTAPLPPLAPEPPGYTAPAGGYRPPFAPHGPWGPTQQQPYQQAPPQLPRRPRRPRERSKLGRLTFFAVLVVIGVMAAAGMAGAGIPISAYFAAALVTIALGLIVGTWLGRARGLIALALLCSLALGVSSGAERFGSQLGKSVYRPATLAAVADRYDFKVGNATLDLRGVDFTGQQQTITATMRFGQLKVLLPPTVDTTATVHLKNGLANVLGKEMNDHNVDGTTVTDLGTDGTGGGTLSLDLQMDTGNVEVSR
jgi:phage shock protein PspC (stress-responsive transcriptional regulator)